MKIENDYKVIDIKRNSSQKISVVTVKYSDGMEVKFSVIDNEEQFTIINGVKYVYLGLEQ